MDNQIPFDWYLTEEEARQVAREGLKRNFSDLKNLPIIVYKYTRLSGNCVQVFFLKPAGVSITVWKDGQIKIHRKENG